jgi:putative two-component system response regulator
MSETTIGTKRCAGRILVVDDKEANLRLLEDLLRTIGGYANVECLSDSRKFVRLYTELQPDLILLDLHMPHVDGFAIMEQLKALVAPNSYVPILVLTADVTPATKVRALAGGAKDFVTKPIDATEVLLRVNNLLETRSLHMALKDQNAILEVKVSERTQDLESAQTEILSRLALAAEYRDDITGRHAQRVGDLAAHLAGRLGVPRADVEMLRHAAPLHDVGKIGIPDSILLKPERLTSEEYAVMKTHTTLGAQMLSGSPFRLLRMAEEIALSHHERWTGSGYPRGLRQDEIPLMGRIVAVADTYDALTSDRAYRPAHSPEVAWALMSSSAPRDWDPDVIAALRATLHDAGGALAAPIAARTA